MPKYLDESGVRRVWQTAENTFLKTDEADESFLRKADAASEYLRTSAAENTYAKAADVRNTYLRTDDAADTYLTAADAENIYLKTADAGAISEENYTTAEKQKLAGLSNYELPAATDQQLGGVKVGEGLEVNAQGILSVTPPDPNVDWENVNNQPTTLEGYGITDAATKADIAAIENHMSGFYIYRGKVSTLDDLSNIQNPRNGDTYDVEDSGVNYAWNAAENRWDSMGGLGNIASLSEHEMDILMHIASTRDVLLYLLNEGGTITFDCDIPIAATVTITQNTTLDLSNRTLTSTANGFAFIVDGATLTLRGGSINAHGSVAKAVNGGSIIIESGNYSSDDVSFVADGSGSSFTASHCTISGGAGTLVCANGGVVNIEDSTIICLDGVAVSTVDAGDGTTNEVNMASGNIIARVSTEGFASCGVCLANKDRFIMTGGRITSTDGCGLVLRDGRAIIRNGIIAAEGTGTGWVGSNGTKMSHSAIIFHESAKDTHYGMRLEVYDGYFEGANLALEILSENIYPNIFIIGGTFVPSI